MYALVLHAPWDLDNSNPGIQKILKKFLAPLWNGHASGGQNLKCVIWVLAGLEKNMNVIFPRCFLMTSKKIIDFSAFKEFETDLGGAKNIFSFSYF